MNIGIQKLDNHVTAEFKNVIFQILGRDGLFFSIRNPVQNRSLARGALPDEHGIPVPSARRQQHRRDPPRPPDRYPQSIEAHRMAGDVKYLLKAAVARTKAFDAFDPDLTNRLPCPNVTSNLSMTAMKTTTILLAHITTA